MENKTAEEILNEYGITKEGTESWGWEQTVKAVNHASLQCAEMKEENERLGKMILEEPYQTIERLKAELLERDAIWLPAKDAEIESSHIEIKQLQEEVERLREDNKALKHKVDFATNGLESILRDCLDFTRGADPSLFKRIQKALSGKESKTDK